MNCTAFTYYVMLINGQTHMYLTASSVKIVTERVAVVYRFKSASSHVETYMCVIGL